MSAPESTLRAAEQVARLLKERGLFCVVIGAVAMAAHHYVRHTEDIDLGTIADSETLRSVGGALRAAGYEVEFREPDAQDPWGGVLDVSGPFGLVQVISFADRFPAVIRDASRESVLLAVPPVIMACNLHRVRNWKPVSAEVLSTRLFERRGLGSRARAGRGKP
ncbi:MAG: hypothetical protein KGS60_15800 [Verrucomicrobia bacterium]|nr:hypothetical protein [Verrucomicrobiota bacterium]